MLPGQGGDHLGELRPSMGQGPRLVEDGRATMIDLLENGRVADDDPRRADNEIAPRIATGMAISERARSGDHQDGQNRTGWPLLTPQAVSATSTAKGV